MARIYNVYAENKYLDKKKYPISKSLGMGGFGSVTMHGNDTEQVAMKTFRGNDAREEFMFEVRCYNNLGYHENIVKFIEAFMVRDDEEEYFIVMECFGKGDLSRIYEDFSDYKEEHVREIIIQVVKGLLHLNSNNFVHRDIKPENVFVRSWEKPLSVAIGDFNFTNRAEGNKMTVFLSNLGTGIYKTPEMRVGVEYNQKCDVWSTGVMLYQLLSGKQNPFNGEPPTFRGNPEQQLKALHDWYESRKNNDFYQRLSRVSDEGRVLVGTMLTGNYIQRTDLTEILQSNWVKLKFPTNSPMLYENE